MPTDKQSGLVEPDIVVNGRALTFAECMSVRVAIGSFRITLSDPEFRAGIGEQLAGNYDRHLSAVEQTMLRGTPAGANAFHAHLDVCAGCRDHPFDLCATGARLLREAVDASDRP